MIAKIDPLWVSSLKRAARSFVQGYLGFILAAWFGLGDHNVSGLIDAFRDLSDAAAGTGLVYAIIAGGWRGLLDPSPIPSLNDAPAEEPTPVN